MKTKLLAKAGMAISKAAGRTGLVLKKKSPEILLAAGLVSFAGTVVLACKATLKANDILDKHQEEMSLIEQAHELEDPEYTEEDYRKDLMVQKLKTIGAFTKEYAPAMALAALSVTCFVTSRNITHKRYLGAVAAYNALSEAFQSYRKRVVDEYGEKMDRHFRYGTTYETITETNVDEEGKKTKEKKDVERTNLDAPSDQAVFFDSRNPNWDESAGINKQFIRAQECLANDILHARGHLFLNEVYDMLGFPHTQAGSILGWVNGLGDDYVDFGLYNAERESCRRFVNGDENVILLDFNHDGVIWDKI